MHAKPDLRLFLKWMIYRSGSVIADVMSLNRIMKPTLTFSVLMLCLLGCNGSPTGDEATGRLSEVERTRTEQRQRIANLENDKTSLSEENRRLQAELAAATGGKGLDIEERQRLLDERRAALDTLEEQLTGRETAIIEREQKLVQNENDFYKKTNDKMTDLGEARHVTQEYENMRSEKDAAVAKAEWWLKFVWGVSIALGLAVLGICIMVYRSLSMHASQRREMEYRQEVAQLLGTSITQRLPPDQAATIIDAFDRLVHLEDKRDRDLQGEANAT